MLDSIVEMVELYTVFGMFKNQDLEAQWCSS